MTLPSTRRRFTVDEYYDMAKVGILGEDDRVELIDGEIVEMSPIGKEHAGRLDRLNFLFVTTFGQVAQVRIQNPIHLDERDEPQPDVSLLRPRSDFYTTGHPTPADVLLILEVSDSSLAFDREIKGPLYAHNNIPDYWIDDVEEDAIIVHRDPGPDGYGSIRVYRRGDSIAPLAFPDTRLAVADLLG